LVISQHCAATHSSSRWGSFSAHSPIAHSDYLLSDVSLEEISSRSSVTTQCRDSGLPSIWIWQDGSVRRKPTTL
jgi:hypothetical protein